MNDTLGVAAIKFKAHVFAGSFVRKRKKEDDREGAWLIRCRRETPTPGTHEKQAQGRNVSGRVLQNTLRM